MFWNEERHHTSTYISVDFPDKRKMDVRIGDSGIEFDVSMTDSNAHASIHHQMTWEQIRQMVEVMVAAQRRALPDGKK